MTARAILFALALIHGVVPSAAAEPAPCARDGDLIAICGVRAPEDMVVLPGGKHLLVSQIDAQLDPSGSMRWQPGNLAVLDLRTHAVHALYPPVRRS